MPQNISKKILILISLILIIGLVAYYFVLNSSQSTYSANIKIQDVIQGNETEITLDESLLLFKPFLITYLTTTDGNVMGVVDTTNTTKISWDGSNIIKGDVSERISPGIYKFKFVGYSEPFCYTSECAPNSLTSSEEIFSVSSNTFRVIAN